VNYPREQAKRILETPDAVGELIAETAQADYVELNLGPGGNVPPHALDIAVSFYVVSGGGKLAIDGETFAMAPGDIATSAPGTTREWTNTGNSGLKVLVIKHKV